MQLRTATPADAGALAEITVATWRAGYRGMLPQAHLDTLDVAERTGWWRALLSVAGSAQGSPQVLVAQQADAGPVGYVSYGPPLDGLPGPDRAVYALYVLPEWWGRGAGRLLLAEAESSLVQGGWDAATLWVLEANARARRFYERLGWSLDGVRRLDEIGGAEVLELRYGKHLTGPSQPADAPEGRR